MSSRSSNRFTPKVFPGHHCVGFVKAAHGIRGELYVKLYAGQADWLASLETIYLLGPGATELKAWPVQIARPHKEGLIVKVEGVVDRNHSETMRKSGVYIPQSLLTADPSAGLFLHQILGFDLYDIGGKCLGTITGFGSNGAQDLLKVQGEAGPEVLIPFVQAFLVNIDFDKRQVKMDLPEGLF